MNFISVLLVSTLIPLSYTKQNKMTVSVDIMHVSTGSSGATG